MRERGDHGILLLTGVAAVGDVTIVTAVVGNGTTVRGARPAARDVTFHGVPVLAALLEGVEASRDALRLNGGSDGRASHHGEGDESKSSTHGDEKLRSLVELLWSVGGAGDAGKLVS